jgi:uroporphyrinogen-III synthase
MPQSPPPQNPPPTLILTRPADQAARFAEALRGRAVRLLISPLIEIVPVAATLELDGVDALAFSSENAVRRYADLAGRRDIPAWCVGERTASVARAHGLPAGSADGALADLVALIAAEVPHGAQVLHLRGRHTTGDLAAELRGLGFRARSVVVYDQIARPLSDEARAAVAAGGPVVVVMMSPRSARLWAAAVRGMELSAVTAVAISPAAAAALGGAAGRVVVAARPDGPAVLAALDGVLGRGGPAL